MKKYSLVKGRPRGFTLLEVLIGTFFLALALLGSLLLNQTSNKGAMDAQYELLACSIAREPIEIFQHKGFSWVENLIQGKTTGIEGYSLGTWESLDDPPFAAVQRPVDAVQFQRKIDIDPAPLEKNGVRGYRMVVTVAPVTKSRVEAWMTRSQLSLEALIVETGP